MSNPSHPDSTPRKSSGESDVLVKAIKKARTTTATWRLEKLIEARRRWSRKLTIAQNKLEVANIDIAEFARQLAKEKDGLVDDPQE